MADEVKKEVEEVQTNCLGCGKQLKRETRYYRNGKYFCNKRCFRKALEKAKKQ